MRLLADESLDGRVRAGLRDLGHDIERATLGAPDTAVLARAVEAQSTLVTEHKDFGGLVVHLGHASGSVVLVRLDNVEIAERIRLVDAALDTVERANGPVLIVVAVNNTRLRPILRSV